MNTSRHPVLKISDQVCRYSRREFVGIIQFTPHDELKHWHETTRCDETV